MPRVTKAEYKETLKKRYLDLRGMVHSDRLMGEAVEYDNKHLREMRILAAIAKLHGVDVKGED